MALFTVDSMLPCLFSNGSKMTSKCGKNKEVAPKPQASVSLKIISPTISKPLANLNKTKETSLS